jgi:hypothetical protein
VQFAVSDIGVPGYPFIPLAGLGLEGTAHEWADGIIPQLTIFNTVQTIPVSDTITGCL